MKSEPIKINKALEKRVRRMAKEMHMHPDLFVRCALESFLSTARALRLEKGFFKQRPGQN